MYSLFDCFVYCFNASNASLVVLMFSGLYLANICSRPEIITLLNISVFFCIAKNVPSTKGKLTKLSPFCFLSKIIYWKLNVLKIPSILNKQDNNKDIGNLNPPT